MMIRNPLTPPPAVETYQRLGGGDQPVAAFGSHAARVSAFSDPEIASGDQARARLLEEMVEDGPENAHKSLLARLQKRGADQPADGSGDWLARSARSVSRKFTSVSVPTSLNQPQSPDQLTADGNFVRLGNPQPELVQQKRTQEGDVVYRFSFNGTEVDGQSGQNLELGNCFYTPDNLPLMPGVDLDLLKLSGEYNNQCVASGDHVYSGSMSIMVQTDKPAKATVFRLVPHNDARLYKNSNDEESFILSDSSVNTYRSLTADGMQFERPGNSPFTIAVEPHNDQLYFTVKIRAQHQPFNDDAPCDAPFTPEGAVTDRALCCGGNQDVKYIFAAPYTRGDWFNVSFETAFSPLAEGAPHRGQVKLWQDGQLVKQISGWIGENNRARFGGGGYHAQFGIVDAVNSMVVEFRGVKFVPAYQQAQPDSLPDSLVSFPMTQLSGQCRSDEPAPTEAPATGPSAEPETTRNTCTATPTVQKTCSQHQVDSDEFEQAINSLTAQVRKSQLRERFCWLESFGSRDNAYEFSNSQYSRVVTQLKRYLQNMGLATFRQNFSYGNEERDYRNSYDVRSGTPTSQADRDCNPANKNSCNLCALMPGKSNSVVVVGAHLDTTAGAPNADDNGSGVAVLLEAARIFKEAQLELKNPILFCFWGSGKRVQANEMGDGYGSRFFLHDRSYQEVMGNLAETAPCQEESEQFDIQCYLNLAAIAKKVNSKPAGDATSIYIGDPAQDAHTLSPTGTWVLTDMYADFLKRHGMSFHRAVPNPTESDVGSFYAHNIPAVTIKAGDDLLPRQSQQLVTDFDAISNVTQAVVNVLGRLSLGEAFKDPS